MEPSAAEAPVEAEGAAAEGDEEEKDTASGLPGVRTKRVPSVSSGQRAAFSDAGGAIDTSVAAASVLRAALTPPTSSAVRLAPFVPRTPLAQVLLAPVRPRGPTTIG